MLCAACGSVLTQTTASACSGGLGGLRFCEDCTLTYRGAAQRLEFDLIAVARSLGLSPPGVSLSHDPGAKAFDFALLCHPGDCEAAGKLRRTLEQAGYSAATVDGLNFIGQTQDALKRARRLVVLMTPRYLGSEGGGREWQAFLDRNAGGPSRILTPFPIEEPLPSEQELERAILRAAASSQEQESAQWCYRKAGSGKSTTDTAKPAEAHVTPAGLLPVAGLAALAALLVFAPAAPLALSTDVELPFRWMFFGGAVRERSTVESDPDPLRYWEGFRGAPASLGHSRQWLQLKDTALLRPSQWASDGIAQYSVAFDRGGVYLLTRAREGGDVRYETRLEFAGPGQIQVLVRRRRGNLEFPIRHGRIAPVEVATRTRHDVAISMRGDLQTVWINGRAITTFQDPHLTAGAVGLRVDRTDQVRLFRWSLNLDTSPDYSKAPSLQPKLWAGRLVSYDADAR